MDKKYVITFRPYRGKERSVVGGLKEVIEKKPNGKFGVSIKEGYFRTFKTIKDAKKSKDFKLLKDFKKYPRIKKVR